MMDIKCATLTFRNENGVSKEMVESKMKQMGIEFECIVGFKVMDTIFYQGNSLEITQDKNSISFVLVKFR